MKDGRYKLGVMKNNNVGHIWKKMRLNMECIKACIIVCDCGVLMHKWLSCI
jgi:hypothetical protein